MKSQARMELDQRIEEYYARKRKLLDRVSVAMNQRDFEEIRTSIKDELEELKKEGREIALEAERIAKDES